jgi:sugar-specific transcriptional regulator TrmB
MPFVTEQLQLLGLNEREVKVFTTLAALGKMSMTTLASRAGLPRTTVDYIVRGLIDQGIVTREPAGKRFVYTVAVDDIADRLDDLEQKLRVNREATPHEHNDENFVVSCAGDIHSDIKDAFRAHEGERASLLLAHLSEGSERMLSLEHYLTFARRYGLKLEVLTNTAVTDTISAYARDLLFLVSSYEVRLNILPKAFCIEGIDMIVFRDEVLAVHHPNGQLEKITGRLSLEAIKHLVLVARETAWSVDTNLFLEEQLS